MPAELKEYLEDQMREYPCQRRIMFGSNCFFVNNNMFAGKEKGGTVAITVNDSGLKYLSTGLWE